MSAGRAGFIAAGCVMTGVILASPQENAYVSKYQNPRQFCATGNRG